MPHIKSEQKKDAPRATSYLHKKPPSEKTATEKLNEQNARAVQEQRRGAEETAKLQEQVRRGEKTAGQALKEKCGVEVETVVMKSSTLEKVVALVSKHRGDPPIRFMAALYGPKAQALRAQVASLIHGTAVPNTDKRAQYGQLRIDLVKLIGAQGQSIASVDADLEKRVTALAVELTPPVMESLIHGTVVQIAPPVKPSVPTLGLPDGEETKETKEATEATEEKIDGKAAITPVDLRRVDYRELVAELLRRKSGPIGLFRNGTWLQFGPGGEADCDRMVGVKLAGSLESDCKVLLVRDDGKQCRRVEWVSSESPVRVIDPPAGYEGPSPQTGEVLVDNIKVKSTKAPKESMELRQPRQSKKSKANSDTERNPGKSRIDLFGYPVTAVIRALGKLDWDYTKVTAALKRAGVEVADSTVRIQLRAGKKGERGDPATLTPQQVATLNG